LLFKCTEYVRRELGEVGVRKVPGFPPVSCWLKNPNRNLLLEGLPSHLVVVTVCHPKLDYLTN
jgi:hypothetical protein